jgi:hypothetical protein
MAIQDVISRAVMLIENGQEILALFSIQLLMELKNYTRSY